MELGRNMAPMEMEEIMDLLVQSVVDAGLIAMEVVALDALEVVLILVIMLILEVKHVMIVVLIVARVVLALVQLNV